MKEIEFLEDTYIRRSVDDLDVMPIGIISANSKIMVKKEMVVGHRINKDYVNGVIISSDKWYQCQNGWYYWYGGTRAGIQEAKGEIAEPEPQVDIATFDFDNLPESVLVPEVIGRYNVIDGFWKKKLFGKDIKIAVLDQGFKPNFDILPSEKKYEFTTEDGSESFFRKSNHGGKSLALIKYCSSNYFAFAPKSDLYFFLVESNATDDHEELAKNIIKSIDKCIELNIDIINLSMGLDKSSMNLETVDKFEKAIDRFNQKGIFICAGGNDFVDDRSSKNIIPGSFDNTISVGSFIKTNNGIEDKSMIYDHTNFRIESDKVKMPMNERPYSKSSCASVIMTSMLALAKSKMPNKKATDIFNALKTYKPSDRIFDFNEFLNKLS